MVVFSIYSKYLAHFLLLGVLGSLFTNPENVNFFIHTQNVNKNNLQPIPALGKVGGCLKHFFPHRLCKSPR